MNIAHYLLVYFILSALVAAFVAAQDYEGFRRISWVVLLVVLGPVLAVAQVAMDAWEWLESHAQAKTFWNFLFSRKRLIRTSEELEYMHRRTLKHRSTGSIRDRLWRLAERCYFKANNYRPETSTDQTERA